MIAPHTIDADFVIIGAGSAGSALAYRLAEDGRYSVLLLEFGGSDLGPLIQMPASLSMPMNMKQYNWGYHAEPEDALGGRRLACPRGKVIGGSSSINGMIYVRGHARDYDHWRDQGATGWGYNDVLPYFHRMETWHQGNHSPDYVDEGFRGNSGPLHVTRGLHDNPLHAAMISSANKAGYKRLDDYNGRHQEGFAPADMTIWRGRRWSAANAYLRPALKNRMLRLITRALVDKILISNGRAVGVAYQHKGRACEVRTRREVILAAGAINTPQILQRSGIGPADLLLSHGISTLADRSGVGANLQDHLEVYLQFTCLKPITLYRYLNLPAKAWIGLRWLVTKTGPGASNHFETLGFIRSGEGISYPDIQFHFLPVAIKYDGTAASKGHGFQLHVGPMRSQSRGWVRIKDTKPETAPEIRFNYMSHHDDWVEFRQAIRLARTIVRQSPMDEYRGGEIQPGDEATSNAALDAFIREHVESAYHPCGTARMGAPDDPQAVVDPECRVIGIDNLRVADSSIFPRITNGNINAPSIMVGEKAADMILGKPPLPPLDISAS